MVNEFWLTYQAKKTEFLVNAHDVHDAFERNIILVNIDKIWCEHLQRISLLREIVGWRGYGQRNPLYEYKREAFHLFETRNQNLRQLVIYDLLRSVIL